MALPGSNSCAPTVLPPVAQKVTAACSCFTRGRCNAADAGPPSLLLLRVVLVLPADCRADEDDVQDEQKDQEQFDASRHEQPSGDGGSGNNRAALGEGCQLVKGGEGKR